MNKRRISVLCAAVFLLSCSAPVFSFELTRKQILVPRYLPARVGTPEAPAPVFTAKPLAAPLIQGKQVISAHVPRTPAEISDYLKTMRRLIDRYNSVVGSLMLRPGSSMYISPDADSLAAANEQTQQLAQEIRGVIPPGEIAQAHNGLAASMSSVESFLAAGGNSLEKIPTALSLATTIQSTMTGYHNSVQNLIRKHGLSMALDPFAGEDATQRDEAAQQFAAMKDGLLNGTMGGAATGSGGGSGNLSSLFGSAGSGATASAGSLLGGLGSGALGGAGGGALAGAGLNNVNPQQLGQLLQSLTGALGGSSGAAAGGAGGLGNLLQQLGGSGAGGLLQQSSGSAGGSGDINSLMNELGGD